MASKDDLTKWIQGKNSQTLLKAIHNPDCDGCEAYPELLRRLSRAEQLEDWAKANIDDMECRGDEDCDHCDLRAILDAEQKGGKNG